MGNHDEYSNFFDLCSNFDDDLIDDMDMKKVYDSNGQLIEKPTAAQKAQQDRKYCVFWDNYGLDQNVSFFNNYNYTVYVPSNAAVNAAINAGLPTWTTLREEFDAAPKDTVRDDKGELTEEWYFRNTNDSLRIAAKINYLINVLRLHFQDQSIFADRTSRPTVENSTACYFVPKGQTEGNFLKTAVTRNGGQQMTVQALDIKGKPVGGIVNVVGDDELTKNVMARDISCVTGDAENGKSPVNVTTMHKIKIGSSSSAVVHLVDGMLRRDETYPDWNDISQVRAVLRQCQIKNKE